MTRELADKLVDDGRCVTVDSLVDHYRARPTTPEFERLTLMQFVERYRIPKKVGEPLILRQKDVVVIPRPYCSPEPTGPKYEQYCRRKLTMHQPFRKLEELLGTSDTHSRAYAQFLQSGAAVPPSLAEDIHRMEMAERENVDDKDEDDEDQGQDDCNRVEDWMLI